MNALLEHPDAEALQDLLQPRISDERASSIEAHLLACLPCQDRFRIVMGSDPIIAPRARAGLADPFPTPEGVDVTELVRKLQTLAVWYQTQETPVDAWATTSGTGLQTKRPDDEVLALLAPALQVDELGRLGSYRVLEILGAGGMGVVLRAEDTILHRPVALKVMRPAVAGSAMARQRFLREARSAAAVRHDHIVTIHQAGEAGGIAFLAMELLQGESLDQRLQRESRLPVAEVLRIGGEIADGLAAAHEHGLVHRDVKPSNIWLETRGAGSATGDPASRVKLLDFGLARSEEGAKVLTDSGTVVGTPAYMAPEQADGGKVDARSDLFSLGCVLYQMAAGHSPFQRPSLMQTMQAIALHQPEPANRLNAEVPRELAELIDRLIAKPPGDRPASARTVCDALQKLAKNKPAAAVRPVSVRPVSRSVSARRSSVVIVIATMMLLPLGFFFPGILTPIADQPALLPTTDREALGWILSIGGTAVVRVDVTEADGNGKTKLVKAVPAQPFTLHSVSLRSTKVSDAELAHLATSSAVMTSLDLSDTQVTDAGLEHLKALTSLQILDLRNTKVRGDGLRHLKAMGNLRTLDLNGTQLKERALQHLNGLNKLTDLFLLGTQVSDTELKRLKASPNLKQIHLTQTRVTDDVLPHLLDLVAFPKLKNLELSQTRISAKGYATVKRELGNQDWSEPNRTAAIAVLTVGGSVQIRVKGTNDNRPVKSADALPDDYFFLIGAKIAGQTKLADTLHKLAYLQDREFDKLAVLDLSGSAVMNADLKQLEHFQRLSKLDLSQTSVTDAGIESLQTLSDLQHLDLRGTKVTARGAKVLRIRLTTCNVINGSKPE